MFKNIFELLSQTIIGIFYLNKAKHSAKNKLLIVITAIWLTLKYYTVNKIKKITQEKILRFKISFFDYGTFHFLFREVFLRNQFYFESRKKDPLILSCGSNIGLEVIYFKWLYPKATIICFEPDLTTFRLLQKNIKENNLDKVYLYNKALSDRSEKISFYIDNSHPGWLTMSTIKSRMPKDKIIIQAEPLSKYINKKVVDFLAMDIEGSEGKVFEELKKSKKISLIKKMLIEYHHNINKAKLSDFLRILEINGFDYRLSSVSESLNKENTCQDILIYAQNRLLNIVT